MNQSPLAQSLLDVPYTPDFVSEMLNAWPQIAACVEGGGASVSFNSIMSRGAKAAKYDTEDIACISMDMHRALKSLDKRDSDILEAVFLHGYTQEEVASHFDLHPSNIGRRIDKSIEKMAQFLEPQMRNDGYACR